LTRPKADLLQGTLDMLILNALSLGPLHGYGTIQRIRQLSDELLEVEQNSLYPAVNRIEQRGSHQFQVGGAGDSPRRARFYTLTKAGSKQLKAGEESSRSARPGHYECPQKRSQGG
jgi:PadR family transcriptional regulator